MSRLIDSFEQIFDSSGEPLVEGLLDFFVSGSSSVRKTTFADNAETIANANPVVIGGDGRCPNVFGTGTYNVILRTAAGVQMLARDPVGGNSGIAFGADWIASTTYSTTDTVRDVSKYWQSQTNANQGNQPSLDSGTNWIETDFLEIQNIALKYDKTGGALTGQATSTAGDFNLVTNTALSDAAATLTAAQLIGGEFTITPTAARILTLDTAANIISALSGSVDNSNFEFTVVNLAAFNVTLATATGVTLVENMIVNGGSATFRARRLSGTTVSITRLETGIAKVLQIVDFQTGAVASGTGTIPIDDTVPQNTEGTEFMSLAVTPKKDSSLLLIKALVNCSSNQSSRNIIAALFQDSASNALAASGMFESTGTAENQIIIEYSMVSGTTSETTFKIRAGSGGAGTTTFNGSSGARRYGGTNISSITITEVSP